MGIRKDLRVRLVFSCLVELVKIFENIFFIRKTSSLKNRKMTSLVEVGKTSYISDILYLLYPLLPTQRPQLLPLDYPTSATLEAP